MSVLGEGTYGVVTRVNSTVVRKTMAMWRHNHIVRANLRELFLYRLLHHSSFLQPLSLKITLETAEIVLPDGGTSLDTCIHRGIFVHPLTLLQRVLPGLLYLHSNKIAHGDLKPANLLIGGEEVKIIDLGGCQINCPRYGYTCTTSTYRAPEYQEKVYQLQNLSGDVWSLGITLLECCIGPSKLYNLLLSLESLGVDGVSRKNWQHLFLLTLQDDLRKMVPDPDSRACLRDLLVRMCDLDPDVRITLSEVHEELYGEEPSTRPLHLDQKETSWRYNYVNVCIYQSFRRQRLDLYSRYNLSIQFVDVVEQTFLRYAERTTHLQFELFHYDLCLLLCFLLMDDRINDTEALVEELFSLDTSSVYEQMFQVFARLDFTICW